MCALENERKTMNDDWEARERNTIIGRFRELRMAIEDLIRALLRCLPLIIIKVLLRLAKMFGWKE